MVEYSSTGGLGAEFIENSLKNKQVHLTILVGRMLPIITHGGCWTCTAIITVSFEDLKTYAANALHLSFLRTCLVIVLVLLVLQVVAPVNDRSVKNRIEAIESVT